MSDTWDFDDSGGFDSFSEIATEVVPLLSAGSFFGDRFQIKEPIGHGATSTVFRATDLQAKERKVALKVLIKHAADDPELRARLAREHEILRRISHPSIVELYGFGEADTQPWFAMEYLDGTTLSEHIEANGPMTLEDTRVVISQMASALEVAHAEGVVHRDVKPSNIVLLGGDPQHAKLIDFGLSLLRSGAAKLTEPGMVVGTPRYMAPELIASVREAGQSVDIYALGVTCYEMLRGESPFAASDHGQLLGAIISGRRQSLDDHRKDLPPAVSEVLDRAMAVDLTERFSTVSLFAEALNRACFGESPKPVQVRKKAPKQRKNWRKLTTKSAVIALCIFVTVMIAALVVTLFQ